MKTKKIVAVAVAACSVVYSGAVRLPAEVRAADTAEAEVLPEQACETEAAFAEKITEQPEQLDETETAFVEKITEQPEQACETETAFVEKKAEAPEQPDETEAALGEKKTEQPEQACETEAALGEKKAEQPEQPDETEAALGEKITEAPEQPDETEAALEEKTDGQENPGEPYNGVLDDSDWWMEIFPTEEGVLDKPEESSEKPEPSPAAPEESSEKPEIFPAASEITKPLFPSSEEKGQQKKKIPAGTEEKAPAHGKYAGNRSKTIRADGIEEGKVYRGKAASVIRPLEAGEKECVIRLTRNGRKKDDEDVTAQFVHVRKGTAGEEIVLADPEKIKENDGTYTLLVKCKDREGKEVEKKLNFALNRFGSGYTFGEKIRHLDGACVRTVNGSLKLTEYNPGKLLADSSRIEVTRDGHPLKDVAFSVCDRGVERKALSGGYKGWHRYDYVIDGKNFLKEGIYQIVISSGDCSGNRQDSLKENSQKICFRVDRTAPVLNMVEGLEKRVAGANKMAAVEISDAMGLRNVKIYADGKVIREKKKFDGENSCRIEFPLQEGRHHIRITAADLAGNRFDSDEKTSDGRYKFCPAYPFERKILVGGVEEAQKKAGPLGFLWKIARGCGNFVHKVF
jgi:hypothetical protein